MPHLMLQTLPFYYLEPTGIWLSQFLKAFTCLIYSTLSWYSLFKPVCVWGGACACGVSRWLKFEEDVEDGGERWSKPYVATLSLHSLFELRSCILNGTVLLDMRANSIEEIAGEHGGRRSFRGHRGLQGGHGVTFLKRSTPAPHHGG